MRTPTVLRRRPGRSSLVLVASVLMPLSLLAAGVALGHSSLESADPKANSTVTESPTLIVANFTEKVDPTRSSMELRGPDGSVLARGGVAPGDPEAVQMTITPPTLAVGTYEVRWTTVTPDDNGIERGTYTITVAAAATPPASPASSPSPAEEATAEASSEASETPELSVGPSVAGSPEASATASAGQVGGGSGPDLVVIGGVAAVLAVVVAGAVVLVARSRRA